MSRDGKKMPKDRMAPVFPPASFENYKLVAGSRVIFFTSINLLGAVTPGMTQILLRAGSSHLPRHIVCHAVSPGDTENTWRQISVGV